MRHACYLREQWTSRFERALSQETHYLSRTRLVYSIETDIRVYILFPINSRSSQIFIHHKHTTFAQHRNLCSILDARN